MTTFRPRTGLASVATLAGLAAALVVAHAAAPEWARQAGLDVWNLSTLQNELREARADEARIRAQWEQFCRQLAASDHVADRLIAGEVSLAEAAAELAAINADRSDFPDALRFRYPGVPDRRLYARYTIGRVIGRLGTDPPRKAAVVARLEAEYARLPE